jgi:hypothetical protein
MRSFITMIAAARHNFFSNAKGGSIVEILATLTLRVSETTRFLFARLSGRAAVCYATVPVCGDRRSSARSRRTHAEQHAGMPCQGWCLVKQAPGRSARKS